MMKFMNASGCHCTTLRELIQLKNCELCDIVVSKSCTLYSRIGNEQPRYYGNENVSINSTGLANKGFFFYLSMVPIFKKSNKEYIISIADLENIEKIIIMLNNYADHTNTKINIEVNLSCPNIVGKGQIGYNFDKTEELFELIFTKINLDLINVGFKLPPYFDINQYNKMSNIIKSYPVSHITCINSLGMGFVFSDDYKPVIKPNNGYGGIGGAVIKPIALANVRKFNELLSNTSVKIYGCGGIVDGRDVLEHKLCGADVIQIGTELYKYGPSIFTSLQHEYNIELHNYLRDFNTNNNKIFYDF